MGNAPFDHDSLLTSLLENWAERFTPDHTLQHKLIEATIARTIDLLPELAEEADIDEHLFKTMHAVALENFGLESADELQHRDRKAS